jgi:hypothetical protein
MAEKQSSDSSTSVFSLNTIVTVLTLIGGLFLVSNRLTSERPQPTSKQGTVPLGPQNIESRLWEDPFAAWNKLDDDRKTNTIKARLDVLVDTLTNHCKCSDSTNLLILGVMLSGQPYAEDTESRIRTRYAVGAALGAAGYEPVEAAHIGLAACRWPDSRKLDIWKKNGSGRMWSGPWAGCPDLWTNCDPKLTLRVPFELYKSSEFFPSQGPSREPIRSHYAKVLLVWLDEEYFNDDPAAALTLFLNEVNSRRATNLTASLHPKWAIIGPRTSSTLKSLLETEESPPGIRNTLRSVCLIMATPSAMDEVLLPSANSGPAATNASSVSVDHARKLVIDELVKGHGFGSVRNFACTDRQLAREALDELKLRGIDPSSSNSLQHLVLVSESDTFFARMNCLAFAGEMLWQTNCSGYGECRDTSRFIAQVRDRTNLWPKTLHRYVYPQGLDGEAADLENGRSPQAQAKSDNTHPTSLEEIRKWQPDANVPAGSPQYDYLARLGDQIIKLNRDLWREGRGKVAAVGIIGSDVYDTLLILQALRGRLPDAVFFTNDLDARFWHPHELASTRNLLVFSGYGLELASSIQSGVPPFRESAQCAEFLATLSAVEDPRCSQVLDDIPPRRFEISRHGPVDISVSSESWIHPHPRFEPRPTGWVIPLALAIALALVVAVLVWVPLRRLAWPSRDCRCEPLVVGEEDFGGTEGIEMIRTRLANRNNDLDPLVAWLLEPRNGQRPFDSSDINPHDLVEKCNSLIFMNWGDRRRIADILRDAESAPGLPPSRTQPIKQLLNTFNREALSIPDPREVYDNRKALNAVLAELIDSRSEAGSAAESARKISLSNYGSRRLQTWVFWGATLVISALFLRLSNLAWHDTYRERTGEPFNFVGTSIWPSEFLRLAVFALSAVVIVKTQFSLAQVTRDLTRKYRFSLRRDDATSRRFWPPEAPVTKGEVDANTLWSEFQETRSVRRRLPRVALAVLLYVVFGFAITWLGGFPFSPYRGNVLENLDPRVLTGSALGFLILTFWMIDAALVCAWFIHRLSQAATKYPEPTIKHFARERSIEDGGLIQEWLDMQLIADLTEAVAKLVYWPFVAFLLMLIARNSWWDHWTWHWPLVLIFGLNLIFAGSSSIILQRAARQARQRGLADLKAKAYRKQRQTAASVVEHEVRQAEALVEEINSLSRGAFAPLSKNPLIGALVLNSGGAVLVEVLVAFLSK